RAREGDRLGRLRRRAGGRRRGDVRVRQRVGERVVRDRGDREGAVEGRVDAGDDHGVADVESVCARRRERGVVAGQRLGGDGDAAVVGIDERRGELPEREVLHLLEVRVGAGAERAGGEVDRDVAGREGAADVVAVDGGAGQQRRRRVGQWHRSTGAGPAEGEL